MTSLELVRCFDIVAHFIFFLIVIWEAIDLPKTEPLLNVSAVIAGLISLFISVTCWTYGRSVFFLILHTLWEYGMIILLCALFFKLKNKRNET
jgi:hypothetical protein